MIKSKKTGNQQFNQKNQEPERFNQFCCDTRKDKKYSSSRRRLWWHRQQRIDTSILTQTWLAVGHDLVQIYLHKLLNGLDLDQTIPIVDPDLARRWIHTHSFMSLFFILFVYCFVHSTSRLGYWFIRLTLLVHLYVFYG